jgi:predicted RNase H-like nuclease (RuvC/YqgF family)
MTDELNYGVVQDRRNLSTLQEAIERADLLADNQARLIDMQSKHIELQSQVIADLQSRIQKATSEIEELKAALNVPWTVEF